MQEQLDAPYLFSETPGQVAKHFNKIAKLEKIDVGIQRVQSKITALNDSIKTNSSNITEYKESLKKWDYLKEFESQLEELESKEANLIELNSKKKTLKKVINSLEEVQLEQETYSHLFKAEPLVLSALDKYNQINTNKQDLRKLKGLINSLVNNVNEQENVSSLLTFESTINKLLQLIKDLKETKKELNNFNNLTNSIANVRKRQETLLNSLKLIEEEFHRDFPAICPLCNSKIK